MSCADGKHDGTGDDFGCKIKSIQFPPSATPTRTPNHRANPKDPGNSWERGIARHASGLPFLDRSLEPIPLHDWQSVGSSYMSDFNAAVAAGSAKE